jgi:hypothetical protein
MEHSTPSNEFYGQVYTNLCRVQSQRGMVYTGTKSEGHGMYWYKVRGAWCVLVIMV